MADMQHEGEVSIDWYAHVEQISATKLTNLVCLAELIDNSLDAGATSVNVIVKQWKSLAISDNGTGIPDLLSLCKFGGHVGHGRAGASGIYGIGFKEGCIKLGGPASKVSIRTKYGNAVLFGKIDWGSLKRSTKCIEWDEAEDPSASAGTTITVQPLDMKFPEGAKRDELFAALGYIYGRAITNGAAIRVTAGGKVTSIVPWKLPRFAKEVRHEIRVGDRGARIHVGIVQDGQPNEYPGLTYRHGYRVIKQASGDGCGAYSKARICGIVDIDDSWQREKNKTDLIKAEELYDAVLDRIEPLLREASDQAMTLEMSANVADLEASLTGAILPPTQKARRKKKGTKSGTVKPTGKGGKHTQAEHAQPGATFGPKGRATSRVIVDWLSGWREDMPVGQFSVGSVARIEMYKDHPFIARCLDPWNGPALFAIAMGVVSAYGPTPGQGSLGLNSADVLKRLAQLAASNSVRLDGRDLTEAAE